MSKKFLIKHVGNMGDMIFFVPPILETLKKTYPDCTITFVTAWGFKKTKKNFFTRRRVDIWGERNQSGFCIALMLKNPYIDQLIHWHDTTLALDGSICIEEGTRIPTWNKKYYEDQKKSGNYDGVYELDIGIAIDENPLKKMYEIIGLSDAIYTNYKTYLSPQDLKIAGEVMSKYPYPRIVLLEGIEGVSTRGWNTDKISELEKVIRDTYGVSPIWFGGKHIREYQGRKLTLRENIATLTYCDVGIGVLSGPIHFAASVGLPVITMMCDQPVYRADPGYFLNPYIADDGKKHRTILGPSGSVYRFLKEGTTRINLTEAEWARQGYVSWNNPGKQDTKSCLSVITIDEIMAVLKDMVHNP